MRAAIIVVENIGIAPVRVMVIMLVYESEWQYSRKNDNVTNYHSSLLQLWGRGL